MDHLGHLGAESIIRLGKAYVGLATSGGIRSVELNDVVSYLLECIQVKKKTGKAGSKAGIS